MNTLKLLAISAIITLFSLQAFAAEEDPKILPSDKSCRQIYNDSFISLRDASFDFNDGTLSSGAFGTKVVGIDAQLNSMRAICVVIESPANKKCVEIYKKRYKALRKEIKVTSVLLGNQTSVQPDIIEAIANEFSTLYYQLKCGDLTL